MAKTKALEIEVTDDVLISPGRSKMYVKVEDVNIEELLQKINKDDVITHIRSEGYKPDEVFDYEDLSEWAVSNGYQKVTT